MKNTSQRMRVLVVSILVVANLLVLGLSAYSLRQSRDLYEQRASIESGNIATALDQALTTSIEKVDVTLDAIADELERQLAAGPVDENAMGDYLSRILQCTPEMESIRVADAAGLVFLGNQVRKEDRVSIGDRDYFQ